MDPCSYHGVAGLFILGETGSQQLSWCCRGVSYVRNMEPCNHHVAATLVIAVEAAALCPSVHCAPLSHFSFALCNQLHYYTIVTYVL